jgi:phosphoglycolate phosphatase
VVIEQLRPGVNAANARVVLFDFDGTLSTIRSGWVDVMIPMMMRILRETGTDESDRELEAVVSEFVGRLTGKQTMYQMIELAENVERRGGTPPDPLVYKTMYLDLLHEKIKDRLEALRGGHVDPEQYMVPGTKALLEALRDRGLKMYLASGTDQVYMQEEAALLGVTPYFNGHVYGALDDFKSFSKKILIQRLIAGSAFRGDEFLGFGDGYVEIENVKEVGGVAVGVATAEPECDHIDEWKSKRLASVGADFMIPNYLELPELLATLFPT